MKKNWKSMIALVMALGMCAAMAGCNGSEESSSTADSNSSAVAEKTDSAPAETVGSEASDSVQETEAPAEDNSALYAYYDELAAEFEKEGDNSYKLLATNFLYDNIIFDNGKVLWIGFEGFGQDTSHILYSYDINTKETREQAFYKGFQLNDIYYHDGYIYASYDNTTYKFNIEENTVATLNKVYGQFYITPSGHIVARSYEDGFEIFELISPDLQTITKIPALTNVDSHGLEQEVYISSTNNFLGSYNNKIYAGFGNSNEYHIAYLDISDMSWHKTEVFYDDTDAYGMTRGKTVGKYMIFQTASGSGENTAIYNMETDEILVENIDTPEHWDPFAQSYYGGNSNIYRIKNTEDGQYYFYQVQHPSDGSMIDLSKSFQLGVESSNSESIYFLNDIYYAFKDNAGLFLRTYEKGETEEEIIYVFEN